MKFDKTMRLAFRVSILAILAILLSTNGLARGMASNQSVPAQLSLPSMTAAAGQTITMDLTINTISATRGLQYGISFDPAVLRCESVTEGTFYSDWANAHNSTAITFPSPVCNNVTGRISVSGVILLGSEPGGPSGSGVVARLRFTVLSNAYSPVRLTDVQVADTSDPSQALPVTVIDGAVNPGVTSTVTPTTTVTATATPTITPTGTTMPPPSCSNADVNGDGIINVLDITAISQVMGQTGSPGWIPADVNRDGIISILDITAVNVCMGQTVSTATPTPTGTATPTPTSTFTVTATPTGTNTVTSTVTGTITPATSTSTPTLTTTPTGTPTRTATITGTITSNLGTVQVTAPTRTILTNENFTITVDLNLLVPSRGVQAGLTFNPAVMRCNSVQQGNFFSTWAAANGATSQLFPAPFINNTLGTISTTSVILLGGTGAPSGQGSLLVIECTGLAPGTSPIRLIDVQVSDDNFANPRAVPVSIVDGVVTVAVPTGPTSTPTPTPTISQTPTPSMTTTVSTGVPTSTATPPLSTQSRLSVSPANQSVLIGQTVVIPIAIEIAESSPSRGAQVGIEYNPAVLRCTQLTEGSFYRDWAQANGIASQVFPSPTFDNTQGKMIPSSVILLGAIPGGPTGRGILFEIRCTSLAAGTSVIRLVDGQVADNSSPSEALTLEMFNGQVTVENQVAPTVTPTPTNTRLPTATRTRTPTPTSGGSGVLRTNTPGTAAATNLPALQTAALNATAVPTIPANARMNVSPPIKFVAAAGETFSIDITLDSDKPTRGAQVGIKFDPAIMSCQSVTEGNFFKDWAAANKGSTMVYPQPVINNTAGTISTTSVIIFEAKTGPDNAAGGPTQKGVFLTLNCTAKAVGKSAITLQQVQLSNDNIGNVQALAVVAGDGEVFVGVTPTPGGTTATPSGGSSASGAPAVSGTVTPTIGTGTPNPTALGASTNVPAEGIQADSSSKQVVAQVQTDASGKVSAVACFNDHIDSNGIVTEDIQVSSPDNMAAIRLAKGVQALTADNYALKCIEFAVADPAPGVDAEHFLLSQPYDIGPAGATFDPPVTLLLVYEKGWLPKNVSERRLKINWYDVEKNMWVTLSSKADPKAGMVSAKISHLSVYAVLGQPTAFNWLAILVVVVIIILLMVVAFLIYYWRRRKPAMVGAASPPVALPSNMTEGEGI